MNNSRRGASTARLPPDAKALSHHGGDEAKQVLRPPPLRFDLYRSVPACRELGRLNWPRLRGRIRYCGV